MDKASKMSKLISFFISFRFDANKSTKGASKLRRDLINAEIANLRDLLPLPQSTRQRLSQLQLMALVCVYVRKANYFQQGKWTNIFQLCIEFHATELIAFICIVILGALIVYKMFHSKWIENSRKKTALFSWYPYLGYERRNR